MVGEKVTECRRSFYRKDGRPALEKGIMKTWAPVGLPQYPCVRNAAPFSGRIQALWGDSLGERRLVSSAELRPLQYLICKMFLLAGNSPRPGVTWFEATGSKSAGGRNDGACGTHVEEHDCLSFGSQRLGSPHPPGGSVPAHLPIPVER